MNDRILKDTIDYYSDKFSQFGPTARGVDWNGEESQTIRFQQLTSFIPNSPGITINDLGCGYGALFSFLNHTHPLISYTGIDVVPEMIESATANFPDRRAKFKSSNRFTDVANFTLASGTFNIKQAVDSASFASYIWEAIDHMNEMSSDGFAFNCLTSFSDRSRMQSYLYYADPTEFLGRCLSRYSRSVSLLHGYGLYEFTVIVNKRGISKRADEQQ